VIVSLHVATGAAGGAIVRSRPVAVALGFALHLAGDLVPHQDVRSRQFELLSGIAALALVGARRGPFDPVTLGAAAASCPDLEHLIRFPRPGGRKLFPSHRLPGWHQVLVAGVLLGGVLASARARPGS
jgi:hypothetical protein